MLTLTFLVKTLTDLYVIVLLLRVWMQWARADFYNPLSQFVMEITQPVIGSIRRIVPPLGPIDNTSLLIAFILCTVKFPLLLLIQSGTVFFGLSNLLVGLIGLVKAAGYLVFWLVIIRSLMSWLNRGGGAMNHLLAQLTEPLMAPIRRVLPAMREIDFSAMVVILILYMLNYLGMDLLGALWFQL